MNNKDFENAHASSRAEVHLIRDSAIKSARHLEDECRDRLARSRESLDCPKCCCTKVYVLSDGRSKCAKCGHKFTARTKHRLDQQQLKSIVLSFLDRVSAERAARELSLNRKTIQKYYGRLREHIASRSWSESMEIDAGAIASVSGGDCSTRSVLQGMDDRLLIAVDVEQKVSVHRMNCGSDSAQKVIDTLFKSGTERLLSAVVCSPGFMTVNGGRLFAYGTSSGVAGESRQEYYRRALQFVHFCRDSMRRYYGGATRNLLLYIKEMEFRFNHGDAERDSIATALLMSLSSGMPVSRMS